MNERFILERYRSGGANRYECPQCGKKKCFTYYVYADSGQRVGEGCGKCNHENSCGYHYPPRQYFRDHPTMEQRYDDWKPKSLPPAPPKPTMGLLPTELIAKCRSDDSVFMQWLITHVGETKAREVAEMYHLGATSRQEVIYWQIDFMGRLRTGKIMSYDHSGHRAENVNWQHSLMKRQGRLSADWSLSQCFFGEHLLSSKDAPVMIVESEKTAVVCAALYPDFLWLATGGCHALNSEKMSVLRERHVTLVPDAGMYEKWKMLMRNVKDIDYRIADFMEPYPPNTDIADIALP
ncbi:MAG: hypothetical protein KBT34_02015 [Prevotella sp.]|nr:hypothetical protein [Candidatus Prevotella equi]